MNIPEQLLYTKSHEWVKKIDEQTAVIGLTDYAQDQLGDIVFVNIPEKGAQVVCGEAFSDVESVKAVSDIYCPVTGMVDEVNDALLDSPELLNTAPYETWIVKISNITAWEPLLDAGDYSKICK